MPLRNSMTALALALVPATLHVHAGDGLLLDLEFGDTAALAAQPAPLPPGTLFPDAKASADFPSALDLGTQGHARITRCPKENPL